MEPQTEAQRTALRSMAPEVAYSGRRFGGKSWVGCTKAYAYAAQYPGAHVALTREERASMDATTLRTLREEVVPPGIWGTCWRESKSVLLLPNGSTIHAFGWDDTKRALGSRYGLVVVDQAEQLSREQFEIANSCVMQVGMPWHQLLLLFNPEGPHHWAYRRYQMDDGDGPRHQGARHFADVIHVAPDDLVEYLTPQNRERFDGMTGVWRLRLRLGLWASFEGLVFGDVWAPKLHVKPRPPDWERWGWFPPPDWPRIRGVDFGYEPAPWAAGWWARDPGGCWWLYRQRCQLRVGIDKQAELILSDEAAELEAMRAAAKRNDLKGYDDHLVSLNVAGSWTDHARGERALYDDRGVWSQPADKDVLASIELVRDLMRHEDRPGGPRLVIVDDSLVERDQLLADQEKPTCLQEEIPRYRWFVPKGSGDSPARARQLPVQVDDHCIDGILRYPLYSYDRTPDVGAWA